MPILRGDALFDLFTTDYNAMMAETALSGSDDDDYTDEPASSDSDDTVGESNTEASASDEATTTDTASIPNSDFTLALEGAVNPKKDSKPRESTIIQDFGQKLGGARKDAYGTYKTMLYEATKDEIKETTLNDNWPQPNYTKLIKAGVPSWKVSAIRALRESNFNKVAKNTYLRSSWKEHLLTTRSIAARIISDDNFNQEAFTEFLKSSSLYGENSRQEYDTVLTDNGNIDTSVTHIFYNDFNQDKYVKCTDPSVYTRIYHQFKLYEKLGHEKPLNNYFLRESIFKDNDTLEYSYLYDLYKVISRQEWYNLDATKSYQRFTGYSYAEVKAVPLKEIANHNKGLTDLDKVAAQISADLNNTKTTTTTQGKKSLVETPPRFERKNFVYARRYDNRDPRYHLFYRINKTIEIPIDVVHDDYLDAKHITYPKYFSDKMESYLNTLKAIIKNERNLQFLQKCVIRTNYTLKKSYIGYEAKRYSSTTIKDGFDTEDAALTELLDNLDSYVKQLDDLKNLTERNVENRTRSGEARVHKDITPEEYSKTFGFRGVEFGNWVEGETRQADLNQSYDAFLDLADALGVEPKALSLGGRLGIRFGSNGRGGKNPAAAHYERHFKAINLTKMHGAGCLAHEWFHALDHYLGERARGGSPMYSEISPRKETDAKNLRIGWLSDESKIGFAAAIDGIYKSKLIERSLEIDGARAKAYWSTWPEIMARTFEFYVKEKLAEKGITNDFLVNIRSESQFCDNKHYPYPLNSEKDTICSGYQKLFDGLKTKTNEEGKVEFFSCSRNDCRSALVEASIILPPERLTEEQRNLAWFAEDAGGVAVRFFEGPDELHGRYDAQENAIYINAKYEANTHWIFYHELFHAMKYKMPSVYKDIINDGYFRKPTDEQIASYREETHAANLTDAEITEEILANAFAEQLEKQYKLEDNRLTPLEKPKTALDAKQQDQFRVVLEDAIDKIRTPDGHWPDEGVFQLALIPYPDFPKKQVELDTKFASNMLAKEPKITKSLIAETLTKFSPLAHKLNYAKNIIAKAERAFHRRPTAR